MGVSQLDNIETLVKFDIGPQMWFWWNTSHSWPTVKFDVGRLELILVKYLIAEPESTLISDLKCDFGEILRIADP